MRARADVEAVFELIEQGLSHAEISRRTGVSVSTVRRWATVGPPRHPRATFTHAREHPDLCPFRDTVPTRQYAYLLGMYLGDGYVAHHPRGVGRLCITCCADYPGIIDECEAVMTTVLPNSVGRRSRPGCIELSSYSKHWWCLLPQAMGRGPKHDRPIELEAWQSSVALDREPASFVRGLIHSDGCRSINRIHDVTRQGRVTREYPRYTFSNRSDDIRALFCEACERLGVGWRHMYRWNISIARRGDVETMDRIIGPKI